LDEVEKSGSWFVEGAVDDKTLFKI